jgi:hypothetical protein
MMRAEMLFTLSVGLVLSGSVIKSAGLAGHPISPQSAVTLDRTNLSFGKLVVGRVSSPRRVTVTNSGAQPLYVNSAELAGSNVGDFRIGNDSCTGSTVAPHKSCVVSIVFSPASRGDRSAKLVLTNSALDSPQSIALSGTGINSVDVAPF